MVLLLDLGTSVKEGGVLRPWRHVEYQVSWNRGIVCFPLTVLERTGTLVPPFDKHATGDSNRGFPQIGPADWRDWLDGILEEDYLLTLQARTAMKGVGRRVARGTGASQMLAIAKTLHREANPVSLWRGPEDVLPLLKTLWTDFEAERSASDSLTHTNGYGDVLVDLTRRRRCKSSDYLIFDIVSYVSAEIYVRPPGNLVIGTGAQPPSQQEFFLLGQRAMDLLH